MDEVGAALATGEPLALLSLASTFLSAFDPRGRAPWDDAGASELPPLEEVVQTFLDVPLVETSALLAAIAALGRDRLLQQRVRREIAARGHALPRWLAELDRATPAGTVMEMAHVLRDGENVILGVALPGGAELALAVYIDHNLGTLVKDAFVVPGSVTQLEQQLRATNDDPDVTLTAVDPADARARITEAIDLGAITVPPLESDTWPACRPLVEWAAALLPGGGTGYERPEWSDRARKQLGKRILASPFGTALDDADRRDLLDTLLQFGIDYGTGDPLRWSPVAVEVLLADWIPRKIVADVEYLEKAPDVLRALIRFSHAERGIRPELTEETLAAVDTLEPEYQRTIRTPRLQGPQALLAALGALDPETGLAHASRDLHELMSHGLERAVGGRRALADLDDGPLPDEPFDWSGVPASVRERVSDVLDLVDRCCDALLDVEYRTAARRLLATLAAADPGLLGRGRAATTAAAVCWIVGRANRLFDTGRLAVKDLLAFFGVSANTPSQRGRPLLNALGAEADAYGDIALGSPAYLTAERRRQLIGARDRLAEEYGD